MGTTTTTIEHQNLQSPNFIIQPIPIRAYPPRIQTYSIPTRTMRTSNVLLISSITASLVLAVHLPRLRAGIPHHRDIVRRLDLKAPSGDGDAGFVQVGPIAAGATTTPVATTSSTTITPTKDSGAQWLSFDASGTSVPVADDVNLVASGGTVASGSGSSTGNGTAGGGPQFDVQGAQSITTQEQQPNPTLTPSPPVPTQPSQPSGGLGPVSQEDADRWIKAHNEARKAHGAGELKWREDLSWGAKTNAERCQEGHT